MKTLYMTKGLPASGKTTWAKAKLKDIGYGNAKRVNKDLLRELLDDSQWSSKNEKFVLRVRDSVITMALQDGLHVIVDDTNLDPKHEPRLRELAERGGALFEIVDFTHVTPEVCIERDKKRQNYVGEAVIWDMYNRYLRPKVEPYPNNPKLPGCIIVDLDGTVFEMGDRSPYDWMKVGLDKVRLHVVDAVRGVFAQRKDPDDVIIFLSGRDSICRDITIECLADKVGLGAWPLYMRAKGDQRKDSIVKLELFDQYIRGKFNVVAVFDDRPQIIRAWQSIGLADRIFNVGDGTEF